MTTPDDKTADPMEVIIDAGTKAMMAMAAGNETEAKRQLARGRAAVQQLRGKQLEDFLNQQEADEQALRQAQKRQRDKMLRHKHRPATTNLGDLLRQAGADKVDKE